MIDLGLTNCRRAWSGLLLAAALLAEPGRAGGQPAVPAAQAQAVYRRVEQHRARQEFNRTALPSYRQAMLLDQQAGNNKLLAAHAFYAGISYLSLEKLDSAAMLLRQSLRLHLQLGQVGHAVNTADYLSAAYTQGGLPDSVRAVHRRLTALYPRTKAGTEPRADLDAYLAAHYQDNGQYTRSLRYRLAVLAYHRQERDTADLGIALANVGELFYLQNQYRQALNYRFEGLQWLRLDPDMGGTMPGLYAMIAKTYRDMGRLDSARLYYEAGLRLPATRDDPDAAGYLHSELGVVLARQGHLVEARRHSQLALARFARSADLDARAEAYYFAGELELQARNFATARAHLRQAHALARRVQNKDRYAPVARRLAEAEAGVGHYAEAYRLRGVAADLLDSAHTAAGQQATAEMEARFQNRDKQRQIEALGQDNRRRQAEAAAQRRAKYWALAGVAGLLLVVGLVGFLLRQRQRTARLLAGQNDSLASLNQRLNGSNAQLAEANQAKAKLFSIISHDLRAPVSNLFQLLELSRKSPHLLDEAGRQRQADHLRQTAADLLDTMDELLAWSKDQLDRLDPVPEDVALSPALAELLALYEPLAQRKNIQLSVSCPPDLRRRTDPNFLRVILRNLLQNAIKFTPAGGQVRLEADAAAGGTVALRVLDSGPGLSADQLAQLRAHATGTSGGQPAQPIPESGHGLGLRLTREFVEKLHGTFAAGAGPHGGSMFTVVL